MAAVVNTISNVFTESKNTIKVLDVDISVNSKSTKCKVLILIVEYTHVLQGT